MPCQHVYLAAYLLGYLTGGMASARGEQTNPRSQKRSLASYLSFVSTLRNCVADSTYTMRAIAVTRKRSGSSNKSGPVQRGVFFLFFAENEVTSHRYSGRGSQRMAWLLDWAVKSMMK